MSIEKFLSKSRARSFLLSGDKDSRAETEALLIRTLGGTPASALLDLHLYEGETLKIEEARDIHEKSSRYSWSGPKIFLIKTDFISPEAQTVLLKTLEEPPPETFFIVSSKSASGFLSPFLSRLTVLRLPQSASKRNIVVLPGLKKMLEEAAYLGKERSSAQTFLDDMEVWAVSELGKEKGDGTEQFGYFLEDFFEIKKRFFAKTYFSKMLLEHIIISRARLLKT